MLKPSGEITDAGNPEQELTPRPLRMVFVKDTPPARVLRQAAQAQRTLHAVGIPRINLARVVELTKSGSDRRSAIHLPYEMIIVAVSSQRPEPLAARHRAFLRSRRRRADALQNLDEQLEGGHKDDGQFVQIVEGRCCRSGMLSGSRD